MTNDAKLENHPTEDPVEQVRRQQRRKHRHPVHPPAESCIGDSDICACFHENLSSQVKHSPFSRRSCISAADNLFTGGRGLVGGDGRRGGNADLVDVSEGEDELDREVRIDEEGTIGFSRATELCNR